MQGLPKHFSWTLDPYSKCLTAQGLSACHPISSGLVLAINTTWTHQILYDSLGFFPPVIILCVRITYQQCQVTSCLPGNPTDLHPRAHGLKLKVIPPSQAAEPPSYPQHPL